MSYQTHPPTLEPTSERDSHFDLTAQSCTHTEFPSSSTSPTCHHSKIVTSTPHSGETRGTALGAQIPLVKIACHRSPARWNDPRRSRSRFMGSLVASKMVATHFWRRRMEDGLKLCNLWLCFICSIVRRDIPFFGNIPFFSIPSLRSMSRHEVHSSDVET